MKQELTLKDLEKAKAALRKANVPPPYVMAGGKLWNEQDYINHVWDKAVEKYDTTNAKDIQQKDRQDTGGSDLCRKTK